MYGLELILDLHEYESVVHERPGDDPQPGGAPSAIVSR